MHLHTGDQFIVLAEKDVVILKVISQPDISNFSQLVSKVRNAAKEAGLTANDLNALIEDVRKDD